MTISIRQNLLDEDGDTNGIFWGTVNPVRVGSGCRSDESVVFTGDTTAVGVDTALAEEGKLRSGVALNNAEGVRPRVDSDGACELVANGSLVEPPRDVADG